MSAFDLRSARKHKHLTQCQMAVQLGVTQAYLSMLESKRRPVPDHLLPSVVEHYGLPASVLPFLGGKNWGRVDDNEVATALAALGYPGFAYLNKRHAKWNPAELLLAALTKDNLESRVTEALPWLAYRYSELNWGWAVREAKLNNVTNRLGFVVALARELAERKLDSTAVERLRSVECQLAPSVLRKKETLCHENMTKVERQWLEERSTSEAQKWNVLSDLSTEQLAHGA
jgi:transcriptional regulator with XRE-family HTH domain